MVLFFKCITNVWGNATMNDLIHDAEKVLKILTQQPEIDPKRISIIGHSEGTFIVPRIAINNSTKVKNIILMGTVAQNTRELEHYQDVFLPSKYATQVLDKNHIGLVSIQQIAKDPLLLKNLPVPKSFLITNNTEAITRTLVEEFGTSGSVSRGGLGTTCAKYSYYNFLHYFPHLLFVF